MSVKKNNKTCIVCSKKYTYCSGCSEFDRYPRWMGIFHNENCKNIYTVTNDYINRHLSGTTKEEARELLDKCDLSYKEQLHKSIRAALDEIYFEEKTEAVLPEVNEVESKDSASFKKKKKGNIE